MKFSKYARFYLLMTQGIFTMVVLAVIGYFIGRAIDIASVWPGVLAAIGALCGLCSFIYTLLRLLKEEDKNKDEETSKSKD
ncbi:MAG: ABC-2 transporter permease [Roseburia sp.]|nr:ABC-2 transporter permease [Anaeroplasma bactoclasticum]MCM1195928.1 ABC-2 transporter permease [Roseburia sp.]MCM1556584.1 ABC-2 transporter permease [Anaeroplasma bactoclasticum]